jgi:hypothetical protein
MAIKRIDPKATFEIISEFDSALMLESQEELDELAKTNSPSRYMQYVENLDESKLKFVEGETPSRFKIRCLLNTELAEIQEKHFVVDVIAKSAKARNSSLMFLEMFNMACLGIVEDGKVVKLNADDVGIGIAVGIGASISAFTTLGRHTKKQ